MQSDFLGNSKSQLDSGHYDLEKVKSRLLQDIIVIRLRALITQEAETEQAKVPEVTFKKAIDGPATNGSESENQEENACKALTKTGEVPTPP